MVTQIPETQTRDGVVGIRFVEAGPIHYCSPASLSLGSGDYIVVRTDRGERMGWVVLAADQILGANLHLNDGPVRVIDRLASEADVQAYRDMQTRATEDLGRAQAIATKRDPRVRVASLMYDLDGSHADLTFVARDQDDGEWLRRSAAKEFSANVQVEQVGDRDRAKSLGGLGQCGRALCCSSWQVEFPAISIKMAKDQGLAPQTLTTRPQVDDGGARPARVFSRPRHRQARLPRLPQQVGEKGQMPDGYLPPGVGNGGAQSVERDPTLCVRGTRHPDLGGLVATRDQRWLVAQRVHGLPQDLVEPRVVRQENPCPRQHTAGSLQVLAVRHEHPVVIVHGHENHDDIGIVEVKHAVVQRPHLGGRIAGLAGVEHLHAFPCAAQPGGKRVSDRRTVVDPPAERGGITKEHHPRHAGSTDLARRHAQPLVICRDDKRRALVAAHGRGAHGRQHPPAPYGVGLVGGFDPSEAEADLCQVQPEGGDQNAKAQISPQSAASSAAGAGIGRSHMQSLPLPP